VGQQHNELLRANALRRAYLDVLEVSEGDVSVERLGETLTPTLDIWSREEWSFPREEFLWTTQQFSIGAVAAQFGFQQIFNPVGSNRIVVITDFWGFCATANTAVNGQMTTTVRGATGNSSPIPRDTRWFANNVGMTARDPVLVTTGTTAAFGADVPTYQGNSNGTMQQQAWPHVILSPGFGFVMACNAANVTCSFWMAGYSRAVRAGELG